MTGARSSSRPLLTTPMNTDGNGFGIPENSSNPPLHPLTIANLSLLSAAKQSLLSLNSSTSAGSQDGELQTNQMRSNLNGIGPNGISVTHTELGVVRVLEGTVRLGRQEGEDPDEQEPSKPGPHMALNNHPIKPDNELSGLNLHDHHDAAHPSTGPNNLASSATAFAPNPAGGPAPNGKNSSTAGSVIQKGFDSCKASSISLLSLVDIRPAFRSTGRTTYT
ncbi:hypothetical protein PGT21_018105 [Puccinia graminis f. sp. tritici]|nr:hypothetical protein PGT21_018105 [Puccinia graminis f. sp. tritici]